MGQGRGEIHFPQDIFLIKKLFMLQSVPISLFFSPEVPPMSTPGCWWSLSQGKACVALMAGKAQIENSVKIRGI